MQVYLNGRYQDAASATVSVDDRGFLFADGVYDVIRAYPGGMLLPEAHVQRLRAGLASLRIDESGADGVLEIGERLLDVNRLRGIDSIVYIQVTRGAAPRRHAFPAAGTAPTVFVATRPFPGLPPEYYTEGCAAITVPDTRWSRCDIKSTSLLPNVLANQAAHEAGAFEALFIRDGVVIEGSHTNVFAVQDGGLITFPASNYILNGITRTYLIELARELAIPVNETGLLWERLNQVDELFLCGTTTEVLPVATVDGRPVGGGRAGAITGRLLQAFRERLPG
ncbi:MAG TPA: aminotransferase class IV [Longimicrobiales bacterium]|nr:aminotransferase class IV [Longimicrobiales bacterium]